MFTKLLTDSTQQFCGLWCMATYAMFRGVLIVLTVAKHVLFWSFVHRVNLVRSD